MLPRWSYNSEAKGGLAEAESRRAAAVLFDSFLMLIFPGNADAALQIPIDVTGSWTCNWPRPIRTWGLTHAPISVTPDGDVIFDSLLAQNLDGPSWLNVFNKRFAGTGRMRITEFILKCWVPGLQPL